MDTVICIFSLIYLFIIIPYAIYRVFLYGIIHRKEIQAQRDKEAKKLELVKQWCNERTNDREKKTESSLHECSSELFSDAEYSESPSEERSKDTLVTADRLPTEDYTLYDDCPVNTDELEELSNLNEELRVTKEELRVAEDELTRLTKAQETLESLIPPNIAIDSDRLPYKINRVYGYGKQFNVFVTKNGFYFHRSKCQYIKHRDKELIHRYRALKRYSPCPYCKPVATVDDWYIKYTSLFNEVFESN